MRNIWVRCYACGRQMRGGFFGPRCPCWWVRRRVAFSTYQELVQVGCRCTPASEPFDQWIQVNPACLFHGVRPIELFDLDAAAGRLEKVAQSPMAIHSLVKAGWTREGAGWTHPKKTSHLTQAKAYATLLWEEGSLV